ncbi:cytochrome P450 [Favolaschia claudopus]|uniref:Cytochrome P450 n=1 Tax=Favolaschia claudopus TaxID=2862362 RepID=A0AAV9Z0W2_9AGAR
MHSAGDLVMIQLMGKKICIINTYNAAQALLTVKSSIYSDRPAMPMVNELMDWRFNVGLQPVTSQSYARQRKLFDMGFSARNTSRYHGIINSGYLGLHSKKLPGKAGNCRQNCKRSHSRGRYPNSAKEKPNQAFSKLSWIYNEERNKTQNTTLIFEPLRQSCMPAAQDELDRVISHRLPGLDDRTQLPYLNALVKEALRWELVYNGYVIPAGTTIIANQWGMAHDPGTYDQPYEFRPERFLGNHGLPDPASIAFGWGKRACPGRYLAEDALFLFAAMTLTCFTISPVGKGKEGIPPRQYSDGLVTHELFTRQPNSSSNRQADPCPFPALSL